MTPVRLAVVWRSRRVGRALPRSSLWTLLHVVTALRGRPCRHMGVRCQSATSGAGGSILCSQRPPLALRGPILITEYVRPGLLMSGRLCLQLEMVILCMVTLWTVRLQLQGCIWGASNALITVGGGRHCVRQLLLFFISRSCPALPPASSEEE